jgi:hypothetical protein
MRTRAGLFVVFLAGEAVGSYESLELACDAARRREAMGSRTCDLAWRRRAGAVRRPWA